MPSEAGRHPKQFCASAGSFEQDPDEKTFAPEIVVNGRGQNLEIWKLIRPKSGRAELKDSLIVLKNH
jgi:hypothetical protein